MAVPAHDARDHEFAKRFDLPIIEVIHVEGADVQAEASTGDGVLVNSPLIDGLRVPEAKKKITAWLEAEGIGKGTVNYKLRDWLFSRQRRPAPAGARHGLDEHHRPGNRQARAA
jgi:leucyl-tRNA synthetase